MGKVDWLDGSRYEALAPLTVYFWSHDHIPPHFNVKKTGHWEIKVNIEDSTRTKLSYKYVFPKRPGKKFHGITAEEIKELREFVHENKAKLLEHWTTKVEVKERLKHGNR